MTLVYVLLGALVVGAVAFGVAVLVTGSDPGLTRAEPEGSSIPLPGNRPLAERDFQSVRFDTGLRGYRMSQVDSVLRRAAYDIGYKGELVAVLEAEVEALRAGRQEEADALRDARLAATAQRADKELAAEPAKTELTKTEPTKTELAKTEPPESAEDAAASPVADGSEPAETSSVGERT